VRAIGKKAWRFRDESPSCGPVVAGGYGRQTLVLVPRKKHENGMVHTLLVGGLEHVVFFRILGMS